MFAKYHSYSTGNSSGNFTRSTRASTYDLRPLTSFNVSYLTSTTYTVLSIDLIDFKRVFTSSIVDFRTLTHTWRVLLPFRLWNPLHTQQTSQKRVEAVCSKVAFHAQFRTPSAAPSLWSRCVTARLGRTPAIHGNMTLNIPFFTFFYYFIV